MIEVLQAENKSKADEALVRQPSHGRENKQAVLLDTRITQQVEVCGRKERGMGFRTLRGHFKTASGEGFGSHILSSTFHGGLPVVTDPIVDAMCQGVWAELRLASAPMNHSRSKEV